MKKIVITYTYWHEILPYTLHGYCTIIKTSTGETPYSLVYNVEAAMPFKVKLPFFKDTKKKKAELDESE